MFAGKSGLGRDLRHGTRHFPDFRVELDASVAGGVPLLLVLTQATEVALRDRHDSGVEREMDRSLCTVDTTLSHDGPMLPPRADVGPVPVWKSPNSPE